jgi:hypothetical protein
VKQEFDIRVDIFIFSAVVSSFDMASDIVLEEDTIQLKDGSLEIEDGSLLLPEGSIEVGAGGSLTIDRVVTLGRDDIEFEGRIRVTNAGSGGSEQSIIRPGRISSNVLSANERISAPEARVTGLEVGTASPIESPVPGIGRVLDSRGAERIYFNGGEGEDTEEVPPRENAEEGEASSETPRRFPLFDDTGWGLGTWETEPLLEVRADDAGAVSGEVHEINLLSEEVQDAIAEYRLQETYDERSSAPETVRVYIEGDAGSIGLGGDGVNGDLVVVDKDGETVVHIDGFEGDIQLSSMDRSVGQTIRELERRIGQLEENQ